jgi:hypothetical protein
VLLLDGRSLGLVVMGTAGLVVIGWTVFVSEGPRWVVGSEDDAS